MRTEIIAEIGSTHDGSVWQACRMVELWAALGTDAVKLQDHRGQVVSGPHPSMGVREPRAEYYARTALSQDEWLQVRAACTEHGVSLVVSPFSVEAVRMLDRVPVDAYKIASGEVGNVALLDAVRETGRPVYLSSGMSTRSEVASAAALLGPSLYCAMQCTSEYPCAAEHVGLSELAWLRLLCPVVGLSDHTMGCAASTGAVALGARVIERHVTPGRAMYGSDASHSLEPMEFAGLVQQIRSLEAMLEPYDRDAVVGSEAMQEMRRVFCGDGGESG